MKKEIRYVGIVLAILLLYIGLLGLSFGISDSMNIEDINNTQIILPNESELESIVLSEVKEGNGEIVISDDKEIKNIVDKIKSDSKKTTMESVGEMPIIVDDYMEVEFLYSTGLSDIAYIYEIKNKYYIEQPYTYIYKITQEIYEDMNNKIGIYNR